MPRRKKGEQKVEDGVLARNARRALWEKVSIHEWLQILNDCDNTRHWYQRTGTSIMGLCPYHEEKTPSFNLVFDKYFGYCFGCNKKVIDLVELIAHLRHTNSAEALTFLADRIDITQVLGTDSTNKLSDYILHQNMKKEAAVAMKKLMIDWVHLYEQHVEMPVEYAYMSEAMLYLHKGRGLSLESLCELSFPVYVFPNPLMIEKYLEKPFIKPYNEYFKDYCGDKYYGRVLFAYNTNTNEISKFKFRFRADVPPDFLKSNPDASPEVIRTIYNSHNFEYVKDKYQTQAGDTGVFGLYYYAPYLGNANNAFQDVMLTEGEFDALSFMDKQNRENNAVELPVLAVGGGMGVHLGFLQDFGIRNIWLVADAPTTDKKGDKIALTVLKSPDNYGDENSPMTYNVFRWPASIPNTIQDLDDACHKMSYSELRTYLITDRKHNFTSANTWVREHCEAEVIALRKQGDESVEKAIQDSKPGSQIDTDGIRKSTEEGIEASIKAHLETVQGIKARKDFMDFFASKYNVDVSTDIETRTAALGLNTWAGAREAVMNALQEILTISYINVDERDEEVIAWNIRKHHTMELSKNKVESYIQSAAGKPLDDFVCGILGKTNPMILPDPKENSNDAINRKMRLQYEIDLVDDAIGYLKADVRKRSSFKDMGQGIQQYGYSQADRENVIYVINGDYVYKGQIQKDRDVQLPIQWSPINGCTDGNVYFVLDDRKKWAHCINDASDLARVVDINNVYSKLCKYMMAWKFAYNDVMQKYLPALIMSFPIQRAVGDVSIHFLTGESASGKSTFLQAVGGYGSTTEAGMVPLLLEPAVLSADATSAALYQGNSASGLLMCIDEVEAGSSDKQKRERSNNILHIIFGLPTGGTTITRGSAQGDYVKKYELRAPVLLAGIDPPKDTVCISRMVIISTKKDTTRPSPITTIFQHFTEDDLKQLRADITVGLISKIPELRRIRKHLMETLRNVKTSPRPETRFVSSIATVLAVYCLMFGESETIKLYKGLVESCSTYLSAITNSGATDPVLETIMYSNAIELSMNDDSGNKTTSARNLIVEDKADILNQKRIGVYYLPARRWIVIHWKSAMSRYFKSRYSDTSNTSYQAGVERTKWAITNITQADHNYIVEECSIPEASDYERRTEYSVISADYLGFQDSLDAKQEAATANVPPETPKTQPVQETPPPAENPYKNVDLDDSLYDDVPF